ncbi:MAG: Phosphoenolpyruvate carboxykinase (ATP) [Anaerolineae bacterium]|nr:Phosphoenolpyruvate carboxykinase (ATP) [Anaerolineae bacterium]
MENVGVFSKKVGLDAQGLTNLNKVYWNLSTASLYEEAVKRGEGTVVHLGPLVVDTRPHTGRSPNDKFTVDEPSSSEHIWWGKVNKPIPAENFDDLHGRMTAYLQNKDVFVQDCWAGADRDYRLAVRIITERASASMFSRNMFIKSKQDEQETFEPQFTVLAVPSFHGRGKNDNLNTETFILVNFAKKLVLIGGSKYNGEIKKSIFTVMNYLLPLKGVMPMHCSANYGPEGDTALFFGLSGTGKTTLSADSSRTLIGDDEHGWSDNGIFNFEGGCYAKVIRLSKEAEPEIFETTRRFGTLLENVVFDPIGRRVDFDDGSMTENTRASYPIDYIPNAALDGLGKGHPKNVIFLTADAFGVLPPISRLTPAQAMYHFISGYTAKVAGTERGVTEPQATFSACFGAPFMAHHPGVYADLLGKKIAAHNSTVWLVNTGWSGGPYGVGQRMQIAYTRAMVHAALEGRLDKVAFETDPTFGVEVPNSCPGVPPEVLIPRNTWNDKAAYDAQAKKLAEMFINNFKQFEDGVSSEIKAAAPKP